jgi:hypothetical protein
VGGSQGNPGAVGKGSPEVPRRAKGSDALTRVCSAARPEGPWCRSATLAGDHQARTMATHAVGALCGQCVVSVLLCLAAVRRLLAGDLLITHCQELDLARANRDRTDFVQYGSLLATNGAIRNWFHQS